MLENQKKNLITEGSRHLGYSSRRSLESDLASCLKEAVSSDFAGRIAFRVHGFGTFEVVYNDIDLSVDFSPESPGFRKGYDWPIESDCARPVALIRSDGGESSPSARRVVYGREVFGELSWQACARPDQEAFQKCFQRLAHRLALHIHRDRLRHFSRRFLNQELALVGTSEELERVEDFVECASLVDLPVLVDGEFGTEKVQVVCALHYASRARGGPLVEIRCSSQQPTSSPGPSRWFEQAEGGTLFLNGLDDLHPELQARLPDFLESRVSQWIGRAKNEPRAVRVIASTTQDLRKLVEQHRFSRVLFAELNFLTVRVPPLRKRRRDIPDLVHYICGKYGQSADGQTIDHEALELLNAYDWPQNVFEMEWVLGRLIAMRGDRNIRAKDVAELAPGLIESLSADQSRGRQSVDGESRLPMAAAMNREDGGVDSVSVEWLANAIIEGELGELGNIHISVSRALKHIGENFQDEITLGELAGAAGVSPSHLCYLFKSTLGITFKTLLGMVRIEKAKQLLLENAQHRITDISLDVGFGDLSHFEKTFKRMLKVSPREYRRRMGELSA